MLIHFLCGVCVEFAHFLVGVFANVKKNSYFWSVKPAMDTFKSTIKDNY